MLNLAKSLFLKKNHQILILDKVGILEQSCNSLVNLDDWIGSPIYFNIPFFETLKVDVELMKIGERQIYNCFSFPFNERIGTYDIIVQKEIIDDEPKFICTIEDRTKQYGYWLDVQQERNQTHINQELLEKQSKLIREAHLEIRDSINYAERLQKNILPSEKRLNALFEKYFLIYKPKDIVSGDFYWARNLGSRLLFSVADGTGHGVPGAILSVIGNSLFNDAVTNQVDVDPSKIFEYARQGIVETLKQSFEPGSQFDGMDAALISIDFKTREIEFAGANNPVLVYTQKKEKLEVKVDGEVMFIEPSLSNETHSLFEVKGNKIPIALYTGRYTSFNNHLFRLEEGDRIYLFTDGYRDQFGGAKEKKIGYRRFKELLFDTSNLEVGIQETNLNVAYETWKGRYEQIDDVCVFGFEV